MQLKIVRLMLSNKVSPRDMLDRSKKKERKKKWNGTINWPFLERVFVCEEIQSGFM